MMFLVLTLIHEDGQIGWVEAQKAERQGHQENESTRELFVYQGEPVHPVDRDRR